MKNLQACKSWGGPATTPDELDDILKKHADIEEKIVKTELTYYIKTHEAERKVNPDTFKIMIPHDQRLENLLILLGNNDHIATADSASILDLPTMKELEEELGVEATSADAASCTGTVRVNEMCVVVWLDDVTNAPMWHLGFVTEMKDSKYVVEHLVRGNNSQNDYWRNSVANETFDVDEEQFLIVKVDGDWEVEKVSGSRISMRYHLRNSIKINNAFYKMEQ